MEAQKKQVDALVQKITGLHAAIAKLPSLSPSLTELVTACVPPSPVDVTKLGAEAQKMREGLIRLCSDAEGKLEAHYSDMLAAFDNPLDHLGMFPYYSNYINLSKLEFELLARYVPSCVSPAPRRVAFIGSGPLPFSSLVLAARHLPDTRFDNYDLCGAANDRASKLVRADKDVGTRMSFNTADVADLAGELAGVRRRLPGRAGGHGRRGESQGGRAPRRAHGGRSGVRRAQRPRGAWVPVPDRRSRGHRPRRV